MRRLCMDSALCSGALWRAPGHGELELQGAMVMIVKERGDPERGNDPFGLLCVTAR